MLDTTDYMHYTCGTVDDIFETLCGVIVDLLEEKADELSMNDFLSWVDDPDEISAAINNANADLKHQVTYRFRDGLDQAIQDGLVAEEGLEEANEEIESLREDLKEAQRRIEELEEMLQEKERDYNHVTVQLCDLQERMVQ